MSKWDPVYKRPKVSKPKKAGDPICRVVPPLLARIPDIADWLYKGRTIRLSTTIPYDLKKAYRTISELIQYHQSQERFDDFE